MANEVHQDQCRICFGGRDEEDDDGLPLGSFISPCACSGSIQRVHGPCLRAWRLRQAKTSAPQPLTGLLDVYRNRAWFDTSTAALCTECGSRYRLEQWTQRRTLLVGVLTNHVLLASISFVAVVLMAMTVGFIAARIIPDLRDSHKVKILDSLKSLVAAENFEASPLSKPFPEYTPFVLPPTRPSPSRTVGTRYAVPAPTSTSKVIIHKEPWTVSRALFVIRLVIEGLPMAFLSRMGAAVLWHANSVRLFLEISRTPIEWYWTGAKSIWILAEALLELHLASRSHIRSGLPLTSHHRWLQLMLEAIRNIGDNLFGPFFRIPFGGYSVSVYLPSNPNPSQTLFATHLAHVTNLRSFAITIDRVLLSFRIILVKRVLPYILSEDVINRLPHVITWGRSESAEWELAQLGQGWWFNATVVPFLFPGLETDGRELGIGYEALRPYLSPSPASLFRNPTSEPASLYQLLSSHIFMGLLWLSIPSALLTMRLIWRSSERVGPGRGWNRLVFDGEGDRQLLRVIIFISLIRVDFLWAVWCFEVGSTL